MVLNHPVKDAFFLMFSHKRPVQRVVSFRLWVNHPSFLCDFANENWWLGWFNHGKVRFFRKTLGFWQISMTIIEDFIDQQLQLLLDSLDREKYCLDEDWERIYRQQAHCKHGKKRSECFGCRSTVSRRIGID